ncbi:MAG: hypothetical protein MUF35_07400 [Candidatus Nanopelagicales bacterium]|nr:hypothetical protein [Candidatus Nanopelagicales bacterium]
MERVLVVGVGAPDRADDAVGPAVIGLVAEHVALRALGARPQGRDRRRAHVPDVQLLVLADPMRLVDELVDCALLVVVDAVAMTTARVPPGSGAAPDPLDPAGAGAPVGGILVLETGAGRPPLPAVLDPGATGTHGLGVATALELARALHRLPARVVVVGVVAEQFAPGTPMAPAVRAALPRAAARVLAVLTEAGAALRPGDPPPWQPHPTGVPPAPGS